MAERNRPTVVVDLLHIGAGFVLPGENHRGERFVDLEKVDVLQLQTGLLQDLCRRRDRTGQHDGRFRADDRLGHDARSRLEPERLRPLRGHDEDRGRAVADLARVTGGHHAVLLEGGLELRHLFPRWRNADAFVGLDSIAAAVLLDVHRENLARKAPFLDGLSRLDVTLVGELVELLAGKAPLLRDHLRGVALRDDLEQIGQLWTDRSLTGAEGVRAHRYPRHVLHPGADHDVLGA